MPWTNKVLRQFHAIRANPVDMDFMGAYNKLLYSLFPADSDFTVVPRCLRPALSGTTDYIVGFEVHLLNRPAFVLELKGPGDMMCVSARRAADLQIREWMIDMKGDSTTLFCRNGCLPLPSTNSYVPSAHSSRARIHPVAILPDPDMSKETAPAERWNCDVLDAQGEEWLRALVDAILQDYAELPL